MSDSTPIHPTSPAAMLPAAREIVARVAQCRGGLDAISALLSELSEHERRGDMAMAGEVRRTVEDMAGHWREGAFVGADKTRDALDLCRRYPESGDAQRAAQDRAWG